MERELIRDFKNPDPLYRSAPFWSWNDKMDAEEIKFQIEKMEEGGFSCGFIHPRIGLITEYLSDKWFRYVREAVEYAEKKGKRIYLYDEDRWPSGFCGGKVAEKKRNRIKFLRVFKKGKKYGYEIVNGQPAEWFNNLPYVDTLSYSCVKDFINLTYERYKKEFGKFFGSLIPAIFTDEANFISSKPPDSEKVHYFPWTDGFEKIFKNRYGYDILDKLEYLVEEKDGFEKVRYDFYRLVSELFLENYGKQIYRWCEKNNINFTGHYLSEDTVEAQVNAVGDVMALYQYMHWPGVDHLGRNIKNPVTLKQCSSVSNQLGKERTLCELYGGSGQNFSLSERKWIGDWNLSLGINFFCPHLYLYSLRGCRKRDWPPTISHHQPYWNCQKEIEDYFQRLNFIMSRGKFIADTVVIHPVESGWCLSGSGSIKKIDKYLAELTESLLENKIEFDFGNEALIEKYGDVKDGKFLIGKMAYKYVVIPSSVTLRENTVKLLERFANEGGKIFACRDFPYLIEGRKDKDLLSSLKEKVIFFSSYDELSRFLSSERDFEIDGDGISHIYIHRRILEDSTQIIFLTNTSLKRDVKLNLIIKCMGKVWKADPFKGEIKPFGVEIENGMVKLNLDFPPVGSHLLIFEKGKKPYVKIEDNKKLIREDILKGWKFSLKNPNILPLDICRYRKGKRWSEKMYILEVQNIFENKNRKRNVELLFEFTVEKSLSNRKLNLVIEEGEKFEIYLNGKKVEGRIKGWYIDKCFKIIEIPEGYVKNGKNILILKRFFVPPKRKNTLIFKEGGTELEPIYIMGDFSLNFKKSYRKNGIYFMKDFSLSNPKNITEKDLNIQGYPFYSGVLTGEKEIYLDRLEGRYFISFDRFECIAAKINVNGKYAGCIYLPPYQLEITEKLKKGRNEIKIEFLSSLRNIFGPHHSKTAKPEYVVPSSFLKGKNWTDFYSSVPFGPGKIKLEVYSDGT